MQRDQRADWLAPRGCSVQALKVTAPLSGVLRALWRTDGVGKRADGLDVLVDGGCANVLKDLIRKSWRSGGGRGSHVLATFVSLRHRSLTLT